MNTPIIVAADDYAQSAAVDAGILNLIAQGRLSAASCLTLSPRWPEAARQIDAEVRKRADIGLHLDFTQYGRQLRLPLSRLILRSLSLRLSKTAINASIREQLDSFENALGTAPDYVDGHQHVHQLPQIREALLEALAKRYADRLPWIRIARPPGNGNLKGWVIGLLGADALAKQATAMGFRCSASLLGVYDFGGNADAYALRLEGWLAQAATAPAPCVLMCHPAQGTQTSDASDPIYAARLREFEVLAADGFNSMLAKYALQLGRGDTLA